MASFPLRGLLVIILYFISLSAFYYTNDAKFCEEITETIAIKREDKTRHLHFYFHDIVGGKNPSVIKIAGPPDGTAYAFGATTMMDDALTEGPEMNSTLVGRAQGLYAIAAQDGISLLMAVNYVFLEGEYNGSSISILGRNHVMDDVREMPVVGGSGVFRFARGYALAHTVRFDYQSGDATVEYNVYVSSN